MMNSKQRTIGINAHLLSGQAGYRQAGIHQYIKQLLNHLPQTGEFGYTVFGGSGAGQHLNGGLQVNESWWPTENPLVRIGWEQTQWPWQARRAGADLLHSLAFVTPVLSAVPKVVTVYDLSFYHYPDRFTRFKRLYLQTQTRRSCKGARRVVTISQSGKDDVERFLGIAPDRIDVVVPGVDAAYRVFGADDVAAFKVKQQLEKRFVLHVGTLEPRKNIPTLIDAFAALNHPDLELVLIGGKGWLFDEIFARIEAHGIKDKVRFPGYVPDADLPLWYNSADILAVPSVYEGFGMPIVEAMACGTPVIASNVSSLPEAAGPAGLLFDPHDVSALVDSMHTVLHNPAQADTMRERGLEHSRKFSWTQSGVKMANSYRRALQMKV